MQHELLFKPSFAMAKFHLEPGESIIVEAGSMVGMSPNMTIKTSIGGTRQGFFGKFFNFLIALVRKFLGGESMFFNTYVPTGGPGAVWVAPGMVGDMVAVPLSAGMCLIIQPGSFVASTPGIVLKTRWGGLKSILGREGAFLLEASGDGMLWVNSYGGVKEIQVDGAFICDTGHMVCFDSSLNYRLRMAGKGMLTAFKSGEGLVFEFSGRGRLWLQSRNLSTLVSWITPALPR
ncbi:MAG: TIGR00266 family protein [Deltaproteobacteria bacterium]|nr:TIGR00266 family protein [Deltaproteobacteria bacterium]